MSFLFENRFLSKCNKNVKETSLILELWINGCKICGILSFFKFHFNTVKKYIEMFCAVLNQIVEEGNLLLSGPNVVVKVNESKFGVHKQTRRHRIRGFWVVGLVERSENRNIKFNICFTTR